MSSVSDTPGSDIEIFCEDDGDAKILIMINYAIFKINAKMHMVLICFKFYRKPRLAGTVIAVIQRQMPAAGKCLLEISRWLLVLHKDIQIRAQTFFRRGFSGGREWWEDTPITLRCGYLSFLLGIKIMGCMWYLLGVTTRRDKFLYNMASFMISSFVKSMFLLTLIPSIYLI